MAGRGGWCEAVRRVARLLERRRQEEHARLRVSCQLGYHRIVCIAGSLRGLAVTSAREREEGGRRSEQRRRRPRGRARG